MSPDETFLAKLLRALADVRLVAIVVGTGAAAMQAVPIMTEDVDLLIRDTPRNRQKLAALCAATGGTLVDLSPLADVKRLIGMDVTVDFIFDGLPGGLTFESLRSRLGEASRGQTPAILSDWP